MSILVKLAVSRTSLLLKYSGQNFLRDKYYLEWTFFISFNETTDTRCMVMTKTNIISSIICVRFTFVLSVFTNETTLFGNLLR